jgi:hypothetical protein
MYRVATICYIFIVLVINKLLIYPLDAGGEIMGNVNLSVGFF